MAVFAHYDPIQNLSYQQENHFDTERRMLMNQSVRRISEGAMMVAMVGLVLFFNRQTAGMFEYLF